MAWIESHQALGRHPKLLRLAGQLRVHRAQALGHLHFLWWWALDYAPYGDVSALTSAEIAAASEWPGDVAQFDKSLRETGWINKNGQLHDWMDYAGKLVERRQADRERKRISSGNPKEIQRKSHAHNSTVPNPTVPTQPTVPKTKTTPERTRRVFQKPTLEEVREYISAKGYSVDSVKWFSHYESNGWRVGKNPMSNWKAAVVTWSLSNFDDGGKKGPSAAVAVGNGVPDKESVLRRMESQ